MEMKADVYYRRLTVWKDIPVLNLPRLHPFIKKGNIFYELKNDNGEIAILSGELEKMSSETQRYMGRNPRPKPDKRVAVDEEKFIRAVMDFIKMHEGEEYHLLDFKKNSRGFGKYVLRKSKV